MAYAQRRNARLTAWPSRRLAVSGIVSARFRRSGGRLKRCRSSRLRWKRCSARRSVRVLPSRQTEQINLEKRSVAEAKGRQRKRRLDLTKYGKERPEAAARTRGPSSAPIPPRRLHLRRRLLQRQPRVRPPRSKVISVLSLQHGYFFEFRYYEIDTKVFLAVVALIAPPQPRFITASCGSRACPVANHFARGMGMARVSRLPREPSPGD